MADANAPMEADNGLDARIAAQIDRRVEENRGIMRAQMEAEWAARVLNAAPAAGAAPHTAASAARPDKYKGGAHQLQDWLFRMRTYLETSGVDETTVGAVKTACTYLEGDAWSWWRALCERADGRPAVANWEEFSAAIKDRFHVMDEGRKARIALAYLRQTTTVQAYTQEFQRLMLMAPETHELDQVVRFTLGLRGAVREEVDRGQPTTIMQAMKLADEADVRLSGYRLERAPLSSWQQPPRRNMYSGPTGMELGSVSVSTYRARPGRGGRPPIRGGQRPTAPRIGGGGGSARPAGGMANIRCYNCGKMGHIARNCGEAQRPQEGNA